MTLSRGPALVLLVWIAALVARLALRVDYAEEVDSLRFVLAVEHFDVTDYRPHFPGYPVFVALGKGMAWGTGDPVEALALVCALCGALLVVPVWALANQLLGPQGARWALVLTAVNPLLFLFSEKLLSDVPGLLFAFAGLAVLGHGLQSPATRERWLVGGWGLLGLALGVRLSYFPLLISAAAWHGWSGAPGRRSLLGLVGGVAAWLVPFLWVTGPAALVGVAGVQTRGHFGRWGGSITTDSDLPARIGSLIWQLLPQGLGLWWPDRALLYLVPTLAWGLVLAVAWWRRERAASEWAGVWLVLAAPYLVWAFLGQNMASKVRHVLPLVVLLQLPLAAALAAATAPGATTLRRVGLAAGLVGVLGQASSALYLARLHQQVPSNAVRMARVVRTLCDACAPDGRCVVYTASLQRHLARHAPAVEVVQVRRLAEAKRDLAARSETPLMLVTSDVSRLDRVGDPPVLTLERSPYVQSAVRELSLYQLDVGFSRVTTPQGRRERACMEQQLAPSEGD